MTARIKTIKEIALFIAGLFVMTALLNLFYTYFFRSNIITNKITFVRSMGEVKADGVFLGDSQVETSLMGSALDSLAPDGVYYNISLSGGSLVDDYLSLAIFLENNSSKRVYYGLDYKQFCDTVIKLERYYVPHMDHPIVQHEFSRYDYGNYIPYRFIPFYGYALNNKIYKPESIFKYVLSNKRLDCEFDAFGSYILRKNKKIGDDIIRDMNVKASSLVPSKRSYQFLEKIILLCKENKAELVIYYPSSLLEGNPEFVRKLCAQYNIAFYDLSKEIIDVTFYSDPSHLNERGAKKFTESMFMTVLSK